MPKKRQSGCANTQIGIIFQFKITLLEIHPAIWRHIQVPDCTLDKFYEHIQTAMGWTNSHLHESEIVAVHYGDPDLKEWARNYDPEKFSPAALTREMHHGLPNRRSMD
jgi:hypothetical protein